MRKTAALFLLLLTFAGQQAFCAAERIAGTVMEVRSGTSDVVITLCDQASGLPLSQETFRPFIEKKEFPPKLVTTISGPRGGFVFTNVPPGNYRLVAQKWTGPFKGLFELHGGVIQLFGAADNVQVPSQRAENIVLTPPGDGVLVLDMKVPNSDTLLVLSTEPMLADPILGFIAPGTNFFCHALGLNVMPYGRTTVIGLPRALVHAWLFANDDSPGFSAETYDLTSGFLRAPAIPFVAGWSDGRHEPPQRLQDLARSLKEQGTSPKSILKLDEALKPRELHAELQKYNSRLGEMISLPNGTQVKVADLSALIIYDLLQQGRRK